MKKIIFIGMVFFTGIVGADERVPEPWDLQRADLPGAYLEVQERPAKSPMELKLEQARQEVDQAIAYNDAIQRKINDIQAKLQNPSMQDNIQELRAQVVQLKAQLEKGRKVSLKAEKNLHKLQEQALASKHPPAED